MLDEPFQLKRVNATLLDKPRMFSETKTVTCFFESPDFVFYTIITMLYLFQLSLSTE